MGVGLCLYLVQSISAQVQGQSLTPKDVAFSLLNLSKDVKEMT